MNYLDDLRSAEDSLQQAEQEFLAGNDGISEALLVKLSKGPFSSDAISAQTQMQNLDESRYIKWSRWNQKFEFSASLWKNDGYPSVDTDSQQASNPDWYSKRTGTSLFVMELMTHRNVLVPTTNGERTGPPTTPGAPANKWLLDFIVLSSLRLSFKNHWEQLVKDIVMKRNRTSLALVAELLGLTILEILEIATKVRNFDDKVIERDSRNSDNDLMYICRKPDPSITPLVDINI